MINTKTPAVLNGPLGDLAGSSITYAMADWDGDVAGNKKLPLTNLNLLHSIYTHPWDHVKLYLPLSTSYNRQILTFHKTRKRYENPFV